MTVGQLFLQIFDSYSHLLHQDEEMIYEVGGLIDEAVALAADRFDHGLGRLFTYFFAMLFTPWMKSFVVYEPSGISS